MMLWKGCRHCGGDLLGSEVCTGTTHQCIQCGALYDLPDARVKVAAAEDAGAGGEARAGEKITA
jgi:hypothetical protein